MTAAHSKVAQYLPFCLLSFIIQGLHMRDEEQKRGRVHHGLLFVPWCILILYLERINKQQDQSYNERIDSKGLDHGETDDQGCCDLS